MKRINFHFANYNSPMAHCLLPIFTTAFLLLLCFFGQAPNALGDVIPAGSIAVEIFDQNRNRHEIHRLNPQSGERRRILELPPDSSEFVAVSKDGRMACFDIGWSLFLVDLKTTEIVRLTHGPEKDRHPVFSPDSRQVAFVRRDGELSQIYAINITTLQTIQIARNLKPIWRDLFDWSSDGRRLLARLSQRSDIFAVSVEREAEPLNLTNFLDWNSLAASWSPDGNQVAFSARPIEDMQQSDIFLVNSDGQQMRHLIQTDISENDPVWSPGSSDLAYSVINKNKRRFEIHAFNLDERKTRKLSEFGEHQRIVKLWWISDHRLTVEPNDKLATTWGRLKSHLP